MGGQTVVVFSNGAAGSAYLSTVSDEQLTFELVEGRFIDHRTSSSPTRRMGQTESSWNLAGKAVAGPLEGDNLEPVPSRRAFWFSRGPSGAACRLPEGVGVQLQADGPCTPSQVLCRGWSCTFHDGLQYCPLVERTVRAPAWCNMNHDFIPVPRYRKG